MRADHSFCCFKALGNARDWNDRAVAGENAVARCQGDQFSKDAPLKIELFGRCLRYKCSVSDRSAKFVGYRDAISGRDIAAYRLQVPGDAGNHCIANGTIRLINNRLMSSCRKDLRDASAHQTAPNDGDPTHPAVYPPSA